MDLMLACRALGDDTRMKLLKLLLQRDYCVRALSRKTGVSESAVSQHLKVFREAGLLTGRKYGYYMHYAIDRDVLRDIAGELTALSDSERTPCTRADGGCDEAEYTYCKKYSTKNCEEGTC